MVDQTSQFYAILTNVGAAKQANADALGIPWKITQMGVGDANGTDPTPNATQTSLINEWRRAPLNQLKVDDKNSAVIVAEQVIPAEVGGRWIREIALYDADGDMIAVANCAPTYKPLLSQGSGRTQVVRMNLIVSSASNVQLKIDPAVVLATREWVTEELARQDLKHSVLVATTGPITLSGVQTIDGVALTVGARVLVKDQDLARDNGIYVVTGGQWLRALDANTSVKVTPGLLVLVERGVVNSDSAWQLITDEVISLGVTDLLFGMAFGRTGIAAGTYRSVTVDQYGRVVSASNPTTVADYGLTDVYTKSVIDAALKAKAPLDSPLLVGEPKAPTAAIGTSTKQIATTEFATQLLGAFGVGITVVGKPVADLDATNLGAGFHYVNPDTLHSPYPGALGVVLHRIYGDGGLQLFSSASRDILIWRRRGSGQWGQWNTLANMANPELKGIPTAPTAAVGTSTGQIATTAFVQGAISRLVDSAPGALDTLNELAAALGNDPNFATTVTNALASKAAKATTLGGYGITDGLKRGDYGLGSNLAAISAIDTVGLPGGLHSMGAGPTSMMNYSSLLNMPYVTEGYAAQIAVMQDRAELVIKARACKSVNSWGPTRELWHEGNLPKATTEQALAGTDDRSWISPAKLWQTLSSKVTGGFAVNIAQNGYLIFPGWLGGLTLQWGRVPNAVPGGTQVVYPVAFPNGVLVGIASGFGNTQSGFHEVAEFFNVTSTSCFVSNSASGMSAWFAIGY